MKANPGGQIDLKEAVGRDQIILMIWDTLEQQSLRINAERRIGKTTIIKKICAEPRDGWIPIYQDLEKCHTVEDFALAVYREVESLLSSKKRSTKRAQDFLKSLGGTEIGGIIKLPESKTTPWKELLTRCIEDICLDNEENILFLWDEIPYMLSNISKNESESIAMEVLDTLRSLRQDFAAKGLRMIVTGSIGIHHIINKLKQHNYENAPFNDTYHLQIQPLTHEDACKLAGKLIQGENIDTPDFDASCKAIATIADCFPFYIHHIVKALKLSGRAGTSENIESTVQEQITDDNDPWELNHYSDRIPAYYGDHNKADINGILDCIASKDTAMSINDLLSELKNLGLTDDRENLLSLLKRMNQDHYVSKTTQGLYEFKFPLLQRWWKQSRGL